MAIQCLTKPLYPTNYQQIFLQVAGEKKEEKWKKEKIKGAIKYVR
jgi:hypothetical protein